MVACLESLGYAVVFIEAGNVGFWKGVSDCLDDSFGAWAFEDDVMRCTFGAYAWSGFVLAAGMALQAMRVAVIGVREVAIATHGVPGARLAEY